MEQQTRMRVSEKGRLVISVASREELGIKAGDVVDLRVVDHELRISTLKSRIERAQESVKKYIQPGRSLSEELIAKRPSMNRVVLDASAVLALLQRETGTES